MSMEEGFFLDGVALDATDIAPGHKQGSTPVVANLTNAGLPVPAENSVRISTSILVAR
jgi:hypothetical protein